MRKRQSALEKDSPENLRLTSQLQKVRRDIKALQEKENGAILERDELIHKIGQPGTDGDDHVDAAAVYLDGSKGAVGGGPSGLYLERISLQSKVRALADTAEQRAAEIKDVLQSEAQLKHENYLALQRRVCELLCKNIFFGRRHLLDTAFRHMRKVLYRVTEAKEVRCCCCIAASCCCPPYELLPAVSCLPVCAICLFICGSFLLATLTLPPLPPLPLSPLSSLLILLILPIPSVPST